jgi:hypothetical protein
VLCCATCCAFPFPDTPQKPKTNTKKHKQPPHNQTKTKTQKNANKRIHVTKRDLFYTDVKLFEDQGQSDAVLDDLSCMLGCTRSSLHVVASEKGVVVGRLSFREDGDFIDCARMGVGGKAIPPNVDKVRVVCRGSSCREHARPERGEVCVCLWVVCVLCACAFLLICGVVACAFGWCWCWCVFLTGGKGVAPSLAVRAPLPPDGPQHRPLPTTNTLVDKPTKKKVTDIQSDALFILLVEKDAAFMRLAGTQCVWW